MASQKIVSGFELIPEIHYDKSGKAVKVKMYFDWNQRDRGESEYSITDAGTYTEQHYDPEHGGSLRPYPCDTSRLEELDKYNPHSIPLRLVLGQDRTTIDRVLTERKVGLVKHISN